MIIKYTSDDQVRNKPNISISNSEVNEKNIPTAELKHRIDTIILSIYLRGNFKIEDVLQKKYLEKYDILNSENPNSKFTEYHLEGLETKFTIRRYRDSFSYHYLTIKISSYDKLIKELGVSSDLQDFQKTLIKILDPLFVFGISNKKIFVKQIDLALDLILPNDSFNSEGFRIFSRKLTETLASMRLPHLRGYKEDCLNAGYFYSKTGKKRIRFYNKELKEHGIQDYKNTYRIEYIFDSKYLIDKRLFGNNLRDTNIDEGFKFIRQLFKNRLDEYLTVAVIDKVDSDNIFYAIVPYSTLVGSESWRLHVDLNLYSKGQKSIFSKFYPSNYYKRKKFMDSSFFKYLHLFDREKNLRVLHNALMA